MIPIFQQRPAAPPLGPFHQYVQFDAQPDGNARSADQAANPPKGVKEKDLAALNEILSAREADASAGVSAAEKVTGEVVQAFREANAQLF